MESKVTVFLIMFFLFTSCNKHTDCEIEINQINLKHFNNIKVNKIFIEDIGDKTKNFTYQFPKLNVDNSEIDLQIFKLNQQTNNSFTNGVNIIINDTMKYKINEIQMEEIDSGRKTMWGTIYSCCLKSYKLNDSLIVSHSDIVIFK